ncbi:hypothetical protein DRF59_14470, partial [Chryseobacterium flavum]
LLRLCFKNSSNSSRGGKFTFFIVLFLQLFSNGLTLIEENTYWSFIFIKTPEKPTFINVL